MIKPRMTLDMTMQRSPVQSIDTLLAATSIKLQLVAKKMTAPPDTVEKFPRDRATTFSKDTV
jgi:hypothetical protein